MFHAASMLAGLALVWLVLSPSVAQLELAAGCAALVFVALISWRLGLAGRETAPYPGLPRRAFMAIQRAPATVRESIRTVRAMFALPQPALVQMRSRSASGAARASAVRALCANPGTLVVEAGADTVLLHVIDEQAFDSG